MYEFLSSFGVLQHNVPLAPYTTFRLGGSADAFLVVASIVEAAAAFQALEARAIPYFVMGGGSNMLVADSGFRGVVVKITDQSIQIEGTRVTCAAGAVTAQVAQETIQAGLTGFEWGVGVPGTIGGALRGNAGAVGSDMSQSVVEVLVYEQGQQKIYTLTDCALGYRESIFKYRQAIILQVTLGLTVGENTLAREKALSYVAFRIKTQPQGFSTGCIFKNPSVPAQPIFSVPAEFLTVGRISAGWLIEHAGAKGMCVGGATVSEKHGNFILNNGSATAADVFTLIDLVRRKVYDTFGIHLEEEVAILS